MISDTIKWLRTLCCDCILAPQNRNAERLTPCCLECRNKSFAADEIERMETDLARANRILRSADRTYDAVLELQKPGRQQHKMQKVFDAACAYDFSMSDRDAEATDTPQVCRRCQQEINEGHSRD